jgi:hypothetical protein
MANGNIIKIFTIRCTFIGNALDVFVFEMDSVYQDCLTAIVIQYPEYQPVRKSQ